MTRYPILGLALAAALAACGGGGDDDDDDTPDDGATTVPPEEVEMVASEGFTAPMDAVASPDGATFYFSAFTDEAAARPAIFSVPAEGGAVNMLAAGPPLEHPSGLLLSADGGTLYVSDLGSRAGELGEDDEESNQSVLYTVSTSGGALASLAADGIAEAAGLALGADGETLHISGFNTDGQPGLFTLPGNGGSATEVLVGAPFESPGGVYVDSDNVSWVMDNRPSNGLGGSLWAVTLDGEADEVVGGLGLSHPAGVSLVSGGGIAVIPTSNEDGVGGLITVDITSGEQTTVESSMKAPGGIRTAREAGVFAIADTEGGIYSAR